MSLLSELENVKNQLINMGAKKIILFGSIARNDIRLSSDIDLIVIFDDSDKFKTRMEKIYQNIECKEGIDILAYNYEEFDRIKSKPFFKHILSYAKTLYEA